MGTLRAGAFGYKDKDGIHFGIKTKRGVCYAVRIYAFKRVWFEAWKPSFHNGRGFYITIGLFFIAFYRGY